MELKECLLNRRSCRSFLDKEVSKEDIEYLLHASMSGPSAMNSCPWEIYVITSKRTLEALKSVSRYSGYDAPMALVIACNMNKTLSGANKDFWIEDLSSATENILLAATDKGLGSVWCGIYPIVDYVKNLQKVLNVSDDIIPFNIIYIGYPKDKLTPRDQYDEKKIHHVD